MEKLVPVFEHRVNEAYPAVYCDISRAPDGVYLVTVGMFNGESASISIPRKIAAELYRALLRDLMRTENA